MAQQITPDTAADYFAQWLLVNEPELFNALLARTPQSVNGIADILSNVAGGITSAAKNVGSFLASDAGIATLGTLGAVYLQSRAQKDAVKVQLAQAQAGQPPAPIQTQPTPSGTVAPFYYPPNAAPVPLTPQLTQQLMPPRNYTPWIIGGGLIFAGLIAAAFRR
jgi:hypothetical protein